MTTDPTIIVFGGATVSDAARQDPRLDVRPPAKRGDLDSLRSAAPGSPGTVVLLEGLFATALAVTVTECRQLLEAGWTLYGASSIGALRAAELHTVGMIGVGDVYLALRSGEIDDDAELAVLYDPESWQEVTVSSVHVRSALHHVGGAYASAGLAVARGIYWMERTRSALVHHWRAHDIPEPEVARWIGGLDDPTLHVKLRDAAAAIALATDAGPLSVGAETETELDPTVAGGGGAGFAPV